MPSSQRHNITAIIYDKKGKILSIGRNSYCKTHPLQAKYAKESGQPDRCFLHGEIDAIIRLKYNDKPHKIFVSRVLKNGKYGLAKPCSICERAIEIAGIKEVEYTTYD